MWSPQLKTWIKESLLKIPKIDPTHARISDLLINFDLLKDKSQACWQVAMFYKEWLDKFAGIPEEGRALALYQDFSSAFVLGKTLKAIPDDKVKSPSRVAEQFMMACL